MKNLKNISHNLGTFDVPVLLFAIASIFSITFSKNANLMEAILLPGTLTAILAGSLLYFFVNQLSLKGKQILLFIFTIISLITAVITLLSVSSVIKLGANFNVFGSFLTSSIFFVTTIPLFISQLLRSKEILIKVLIGACGAILVFALLVSVYLIMPGKVLSPKILPFNTSLTIAKNALSQSPIVGIGIGNYQSTFNKFKPAEFNKTVNWSEKFSSGSNFVLTILTESGLFGILAFFYLLIRIITQSFRLVREGKIVGWGLARIFEVLPIITLIVIFFIFPHSNILLITFFILLGVLSDKKTKSGLASAVVLSLVMIFAYYKIALAEYKFTNAKSEAIKDNARQTYNLTKEAINLNPKVDRYHIFLSKINFLFAASLATKGLPDGQGRQGNLTDEERKQIAQFVQASIDEAKAAVSNNNQKSENWEHLGKTYQSMIEFAEGSGQFAIESYKQAIALDPVNPRLRIALGDIYFLAKDYVNAIENYKLATYAKPDLANAHYNLALAYKANGEIEKARIEFDITSDLLDPKSNDYKIVQNEIVNLNKKSVETPVEIVPEELTTPI